MDSGYYFMVSHLHRHFQAVLLSTIQLENLTLVITLAGRSQCFTGIVAIYLNLFACHIPMLHLEQIFVYQFFHIFWQKYDFRHFYQSQPSHAPLCIIGYPLLCYTSICYFLSQICYQQLFQSWLFTEWHGYFMAFPLPVSTLIVFALISIFSICATSIKTTIHSSFENA